MHVASLKRFKASWDCQSDLKKAMCLSAVKKEILGWMESSGMANDSCSTEAIIDTQEENFHLALANIKPPSATTRAVNWDVLAQVVAGQEHYAHSFYTAHSENGDEDLPLDDSFSFANFMA